MILTDTLLVKTVDSMAGVAKWLRPRVVVPVFVGSIPITRPTYSFDRRKI